MGIYAIKPLFQSSLRGIEQLLVKGGVHPNSITLAALAVSAAGGATLAFSGHYHWLLLGTPLAAFIRTALNALDGMVARTAGLSSSTGEVLNEFCDRAADALMLGGAAFSGLVNVHLVWATVVAALLTEDLSVASKAAGGLRDYSGVMGKADRMIWLSLGSLAVWMTNRAMLFSVTYGICLVLCLVTLAQRANAIRAHFKRPR